MAATRSFLVDTVATTSRHISHVISRSLHEIQNRRPRRVILIEGSQQHGPWDGRDGPPSAIEKRFFEQSRGRALRWCRRTLLTWMETALNTQDRVQEPLSAPVTGSSSERTRPRVSLLRSVDKAINGAKATEPFATLFLQPPRSSKTAISREGATNSGSTNVRSVYFQ